MSDALVAYGERNRVEENAPRQDFSWLDPHPVFVIVLVGQDPHSVPFGIQKDFLCAKSAYYFRYFEEQEYNIEHVVKLPDTVPEVFAYVQHYLFTNQIFQSLENLPTYDVLIGVWKLGHDLDIDGLCDATLEAMSECRRLTQRIPATPLLVQVWKDTPEGSSLRKLLLSWAAEYMYSADSKTEFAKSLPQEVLSELVVVMSSNPSPTGQLNHPALPLQQRNLLRDLAEEEDRAEQQPPAKKQRRASVALPAPAAAVRAKPGPKPGSKPGPKKSLSSRASLPTTLTKPPTKRRRAASAGAIANYTTAQKLNFCADLLNRMLSGPGFWTRLVGPFKEPVDPVQDGVPDYLEKVKKPMDLGTMKAKMDRGEYLNEDEFVADMNQIFINCYTYWTKKDPMWAACEKLQKSFDDKYSNMPRWIAKMEGDEEM